MNLKFITPEPAGRTLPTLTSERLTLRPLGLQDRALLALYVRDRRVAEGTRSLPHPAPEGTALPSSSAPLRRCATAMSGRWTARRWARRRWWG
jgi:hypothetical protein